MEVLNVDLISVFIVPQQEQGASQVFWKTIVQTQHDIAIEKSLIQFSKRNQGGIRPCVAR